VPAVRFRVNLNLISILKPEVRCKYLRIASINSIFFLEFHFEFLGALQNCGKLLLALPRQVCSSVRLSACNDAASIIVIFMKFDILRFYENIKKLEIN
jgi:hypothetical protein